MKISNELFEEMKRELAPFMLELEQSEDYLALSEKRRRWDAYYNYEYEWLPIPEGMDASQFPKAEDDAGKRYYRRSWADEGFSDKIREQGLIDAHLDTAFKKIQKEVQKTLDI